MGRYTTVKIKETKREVVIDEDTQQRVGDNAYKAKDSDGTVWIITNEWNCVRATKKALIKYAHSRDDFYVTNEINSEDDVTLYFKASIIKDEESGDAFVTQILLNDAHDPDVKELVISLIIEFTQIRELTDQYIALSQYIKRIQQGFTEDKFLYDVETGTVLKFGRLDKTAPFGYFRNSPSGTIFLSIPVDANYFEHSLRMSLGRTCEVPVASKYPVDELPYVIATEEQITESIKKAKARIATPSLYVAYKGLGYRPSMMGSYPSYYDTRVIQDAHGFYMTDNSQLCDVMAVGGYEFGEPEYMNDLARGALSDDELAIAIGHAPLYDLTRKEWFYGNLENTRSIEFRKDAYDKMRMDEDKKLLIRRLCESNGASTRNIDLIDGKGGGHIFLLHGEPGTGKTLTAESISELLEKPIYKLGLGEFSDTGSLEEGLQGALTLAERWNAVMLIDEADVALEKRTSNDISRNALVAVFLRLLEYYKGIMFLTSNRAEEFDPAFKSRITFSLHFTRPDTEGRAYIWEMLLKNAGANLDDFDIDDLASYDLDGRQIKNIINTSASLAGDGDICPKDVQIMIDQTVEFSDFMSSM